MLLTSLVETFQANDSHSCPDLRLSHLDTVVSFFLNFFFFLNLSLANSPQKMLNSKSYSRSVLHAQLRCQLFSSPTRTHRSACAPVKCLERNSLVQLMSATAFFLGGGGEQCRQKLRSSTCDDGETMEADRPATPPSACRKVTMMTMTMMMMEIKSLQDGESLDVHINTSCGSPPVSRVR